jgi:class 3 adenylate cyclase
VPARRAPTAGDTQSRYIPGTRGRMAGVAPAQDVAGGTVMEWIEYAKAAGAFIGACGIATLAKLYHDKVVTGKDTELKIKEGEIARLQSDLLKAQTQAKSAEEHGAPAHRDLLVLRTQLTGMIEHLAAALHAQAASLYIPVFNAGDEKSASPRSFAFVAAWNTDPGATAAILKMKLVESWTIVGECWDKATLIGSNNLQANVRHVASYDKQSGFVPVHTLVSPVHWQGRQIGIVQVFNKTLPGNAYDLDEHGFQSDDRRQLQETLQETSDAGMARTLHYFQSSPEAMRVLGLQDELNLENAVIMYIDLTQSSALFDELPLIDAARLINRFNQNIYKRIAPFSGIVEKFNGDGTLIRFHYVDFDSTVPMSNPVLRAVCAAADLLGEFRAFKAQRWRGLASDVADAVKLRITIALGPVVSTNMGPQQFQTPTAMGQCVNRSAKMIAYAPRDRDVMLVDDHVGRALKQIDERYLAALAAFDGWSPDTARQSPSLAGHRYFEVTPEPFRRAAMDFRQPTYAPAP